MSEGAIHDYISFFLDLQALKEDSGRKSSSATRTQTSRGLAVIRHRSRIICCVTVSSIRETDHGVRQEPQICNCYMFSASTFQIFHFLSVSHPYNSFMYSALPCFVKARIVAINLLRPDSWLIKIKQTYNYHIILYLIFPPNCKCFIFNTSSFQLFHGQAVVQDLLRGC